MAVIRQFSVDPAILEDDDSEPGVGVSFSKVTYAEVAPLVGLQPWKESIVMDIDVMLMQYGTPPEHLTEEARSRFFSPVFNHLVKQFTFMLRNNPETIIGGRIGTQSRIEYYFKVFGAVAVLFIEMKLKVGNDAERLKAIAQVIAECDGCDFNNSSEKLSLPVHCVFSDGWSFEFFKFERKPNPSFLRGCFNGDPKHLRRGLRVPDFTTMETSLPFILQLRCVCETIFDVMLSAYIAGLQAYYNRSEDKGTQQGLKRPSLDGWERALQSAKRALAVFRRAEGHRKAGDIDSADVTVEEALLALHVSTGAVPTIYQSDLIMTDWDESEVRRA